MERVASMHQGFGAGRGLAWLVGALAAGAAAAVAAILALVFAATVVVVAVMGSILLAFAGLALRARRTVKVRARDPRVLEARNVGGHSWVAYGWDRSGR